MESHIIDEKLEKIIRGGLLPCTYLAKQERMLDTLFYKYSMNKKFTKKQQMLFLKAIIRSKIQKSSSWSYEKEWCLVLTKDFIDTYNGLAPFFKIKKVFLGCKMSVLDRQYMYELCKTKGVEINEIRLKNDYYELEAVPVDIDDRIKYQQKLIQSRINSY